MKKMKILIISPSAGDSFYCGNCFRDSLHSSALIRAGHDVTVMPLYLPMLSATEGVPIFFPAVSYYLEQAMFRKGNMPSWMEKLSSSKMFMGLAASMSGTTSAEGMEGMTMSMIKGDDGAFLKNIAKMAEWIRKDGLPDIIHLSSSLLIGFAGALKRELGVPVVCSLQDEEVWIDSLKGEYASAAWEAIEESSKAVDAFVTTSGYYRDIVIKKNFSFSPTVIYPGINIDKYRYDPLPERPTIGFFYRMNSLDGLDTLAGAFVSLKKKGSVPGLRLKIGGGYTGTDRKFLSGVKRILEGVMEDVTIEEDYSPIAHHRFYRDCTVVSVPLRFDEGVGLYVCEAFATGRPVVEPMRGSFPEIAGEGGMLYDENDPEGLEKALESILTDRDLYNEKREKAMAIAGERYSDSVCARALEALYRKVLEQKNNI